MPCLSFACTKTHHKKQYTFNMLASTIARRNSTELIRTKSIARTLSVKATSVGGPIGSDGRHEIWREGIYDHDNEPK
jgi:hypothetical protein